MNQINSENSKINVKKLTTLAILSALAYFIMVAIRIPLIPALPNIKYDPKDIFIVIGGLLYGPLAAAAMSLAVSLIEMVTVSESGPFGLLMNVVSTCSFVCTAAVIYRIKRTLPGAVIGLVTGVLFTVGVMALWNYMIIPLYYGFPRSAVIPLFPAIISFNLLKYGLNAAITMMIYKPLAKALRKLNMLPAADISAYADSDVTQAKAGKINIGVILASLFAVITCILLILIFNDII